MSLQMLSPSGEYALRAAVCLAANADAWVPAHELAEMASVPPAYLSKVLRKLVAKGLLHAQKGHHGGFRLARPPASIRVIDVLEAVDAIRTDGHCAFGWDRCNESAPCPLHEVFAELRDTCHNWAAGHSLNEIDLRRVPALPSSAA